MSIMTFEATQKIKYRYKCEYCGAETDWAEYTLAQYARHSQGLGRFGGGQLEHEVSGLDKTSASALKQLSDLVKMLKTALTQTDCEIMIQDEAVVVGIYNEAFSMGKACPACKKRQTWYPAVARVASEAKRQKLEREYKGIAEHRKPEIDWGEPEVHLVGMPDLADADEFSVEKPEDEKADIIEYYIDPTLKDIYKQLVGLENINIALVTEVRDDAYIPVVRQEYYKGTSFAKKLADNMSVGEFADCALQLCDALEFLSKQEPPLFCKTINRGKLIIKNDGTLKFNDFDNLTGEGSVASDIKRIGRFLQSASSKMKRRYASVIEKCNGEYQTFEELYHGLGRATISRRTKLMGIIGMGAVFAFFLYRILSRVL